MSENVHTADSGVCRYPALLQLVSFGLAIIVGFAASIYQLYGVKLSLSSALLSEVIHAFSDALVMVPALMVAFFRYSGWGKDRYPNLEGRITDWMANLMILCGAIAVLLSFGHFFHVVHLHAEGGIRPAWFGLGANAVQFLLLSWCMGCRVHRLARSHLLIDSISSVVVVVELQLELNDRTGLPIDAIAGFVLGVMLIRAGALGGHNHAH